MRVHLLADDIYGILLSDHVEAGTRIGAFQVKRHWGARAELEIIAASVWSLERLAGAFHRIVMNYPGIGNGGLSEDEVAPLVARLPDTVIAYRYPEASR